MPLTVRALQWTKISIRRGGRHSSVDSSTPTILPPRVRVPSTPSMLLSIYVDLCHVEKTKINKKGARIGPFKKGKYKKDQVSILTLQVLKPLDHRNINPFCL